MCSDDPYKIRYNLTNAAALKDLVVAIAARIAAEEIYLTSSKTFWIY